MQFSKLTQQIVLHVNLVVPPLDVRRVDAMQGAICGWSPYNYYVRMLSPVCWFRAYGHITTRLQAYLRRFETSSLLAVPV